MGLSHVVAPLFALRPLAWTPPDPAEIDSILLTSANAARLAGEGLGFFLALPCFAVGAATAQAAREAGFRHVVTGDADGAAMIERMIEDQVSRPLHLCGREHIRLERLELRIERRIVYAAEPTPFLPPPALEAVRAGGVALLHSPRAASRFAALVDQEQIRRDKIAIAAISDKAAIAAGLGWQKIEAAERPTDEALLELAAKLCKTDRSETGNDE